MSTASIRIAVERTLIAIFLVTIAVPLVGRLLPETSAFAASENRRPADFPEIKLSGSGWGWSLTSFPRRFDRWWNDSFAFRSQLIRWHSIVKLDLGVSPSSKALVGRDGWLYYAAEQSVDYFRGAKPFTERDLVKWRNELESRRAWLAERGIGYLVVVAPNKETIYPEYMPSNVKRLRTETRLDQLMADLRANSKVQSLDLREPLRQAKQHERVYHLTDTHWNDAGAQVAYREILAAIAAQVPGFDARPLPGSLAKRDASGGDLARILALEDRFPETSIDWVPATAHHAKRLPGNLVKLGSAIALECAECGNFRAVMNQDSFNTNLAPLLAEHFGRLVLMDGQRLDRDLIVAEQPSIVIQEFVERVLMCADLQTC
jgi:hypothetical protein